MYTVRVIAANSSGDSGPSVEGIGTSQSAPGQAREYIENEVVEIFESSYPGCAQLGTTPRPRTRRLPAQRFQWGVTVANRSQLGFPA